MTKIYPSNDHIMKTNDEILTHNAHNPTRTTHIRHVRKNKVDELEGYLKEIGDIKEYEEKNLLNR